MYNVVLNENNFPREVKQADFCVVGGGMAGVCASIAAARRGLKTILIQDRSVLGGNASSEIRMWICGARGADNKEAGILEEIMLRNIYYNSEMKYTLWDDVLYGICREEENLEVIYSCSVNEVKTEGSKIRSVAAWHLTRQCWVEVQADFFADCSGDSVLRISGAETRHGREARGEFDESHAPEQADDKTMGSSILMQLREVPGHKEPFVAPPWARKFKREELESRNLTPKHNNFWWLEFGGLMDTLDDADDIRDEAMSIAYGVWGMMKNDPSGICDNWTLEWVGSLPGKRENIRYVGDHLLTQNDLEKEGRFDDRVCHGGWEMDDHHPDAIAYRGFPTIFHETPHCYGIPYRSLYSKDISNLFFAGRNISATHMAMSSTRVMGTTAVMGQAVGAAAALAFKEKTDCRGVYENHIAELQRQLIEDDQYIPWKTQALSALKIGGELTSSCDKADPLLNELERDLEGRDNGLWLKSDDSVTWSFAKVQSGGVIRLLGDSDFSRKKRMPCSDTLEDEKAKMPGQLIKSFELDLSDENGAVVETIKLELNFKRLIKIPLNTSYSKITLKNVVGWSGEAHIFSFDILSV